jgi:hypothetical protein
MKFQNPKRIFLSLSLLLAAAGLLSQDIFSNLGTHREREDRGHDRILWNSGRVPGISYLIKLGKA